MLKSVWDFAYLLCLLAALHDLHVHRFLFVYPNSKVQRNRKELHICASRLEKHRNSVLVPEETMNLMKEESKCNQNRFTCESYAPGAMPLLSLRVLLRVKSAY